MPQLYYEQIKYTMDTSTGEIYYGKDAIEVALKTGRIKSANDLVVLPEEIADELH